jgi:transposase InsO family protein
MNLTLSPIETAHFKFALIAPVIQGLFTDASAAAYCRRICEQPITRPDGTAFRYTPKTLEKWIQLYKNGGMDALMPQARSDKGTTRVLPDVAIQEIYHLKETYRRLNATQIHAILIKDCLIPATVSVKAVQRFIKKHDLKSARNQNIRDRKAFEEAEFGRLWQADTCYFPYITENGRSRRTYLLMIVDDHSRLIVGGEIFYNDNAYNFQLVFKKAVAAYGIPDKLYTDSGAPYANEQLSLICGEIGTVSLRTPVRDGASKGKVERNFRTLKSRWLDGQDASRIKSLSEFNTLLSSYIFEHNRTVLSAFKESPLDRFIRTKDRIRQTASMEWLDECFHNRIKRKVNNDSCLTIDKVYYDAPMQFIGMAVEVRFLPGAMEDAYILYENMHYPITRTDKVANSKTRRNNLPKIDYGKDGLNYE